MPMKLRFQIEENIKQNRLDKFLFEQITSVSKIFLCNLVNAGNCRINGKFEPRGYHLKKDDTVEIVIDLEAETAMKPEALPLEIIFEDEWIIVVNKPVEMLVHPSSKQKNGTLLNALSYYINQEKYELEQVESEIQNSKFKIIRPGLVHRLDRKTSGLMVIAKTSEALSRLSNHFQRKLIKKRYLAIVQGHVSENSGTIEAPIGRFAEEKNWNVKEDGKFAVTNFWVLEKFPDKTLLELEPITGRTNQLRIHCAFLGHPIIGDDRYNGREFSRLCLHAAKLSFRHPHSNDFVEFESEMPAEFKMFLKKLK
jgi:23S rRNA pseudouridine1911/1915/1917 synthase